MGATALGSGPAAACGGAASALGNGGGASGGAPKPSEGTCASKGIWIPVMTVAEPVAGFYS